MYRLFFRNIEIAASIGIHDFERAARQMLLVNIELLSARLAQGDAIEAVVDYDAVRDLAIALAKDRHFDLQETYCEALVDRLASDFGFAAVCVSTAKPDVYPDVELVGCTVCFAADERDLDRLARLRTP